MSRAAVILHGAGSSSDFVERAFAAANLGVDMVVAPQDRSGSIEAMAELIDDQITELSIRGVTVCVVGGVSIGCHAAALWASRLPPVKVPPTLLLAMPAWLGEPDAVAAVTSGTAQQIRTLGIQATLASIRRELSGKSRVEASENQPHDWVLTELERAWPTYSDDELAAALENVGRTKTPNRTVLERIMLRAVVIALAQDPLHPESVAVEMAAAIPDSELRIVRQEEMARDLTSLSR